MKATIYNLNNNDTEHEIIFISLTIHADSTEDITVLFDGKEYKTHVRFDDKGRRRFKHCGKVYDFTIEH